MLAFHAGFAGARGGFIGVDVFFVLSGFLITRLLLDERFAAGRIDNGNFYTRRFFRLAPAYFVMLAAVTVIASLAVTDAGPQVWSDLPAAVTGLTNWWLIVHHQSYFESFGRPELFQHTWSLAIEAQFYLAWPYLLGFAVKRAGRRGAVVLALGLAALSLAFSAYAAWGGLSPDLAQSLLYYGSATRAIGLLSGAALAALLPSLGTAPLAPARRLSAEGGAIVAIIAIGALTFLDAPEKVWYAAGFAAAAMATTLLIACVASAGTHVARALSTAPMHWLGTRSYGIYLWHWPVFAMLRPEIDVPLDPLAVALLRLGATLGIAEASYRFVEVPLRRGKFTSFARPLDGGLATPLLVAISCYCLIVFGGVLRMTSSAHDDRDQVAAAMLSTPALAPRRTLSSTVRYSAENSDARTFAGPAFLQAAEADPRAARRERFEHFVIAFAAARHPHAARARNGALAVSETRRTLAYSALLEQLGVRGKSHQNAQAARSGPTLLALRHLRRPEPGQARTLERYEREDATLLGDSIMLAASRAIAQRLRVVNIDAAVGRQATALAQTVANLRASNKMTPLVILDIGNNGTVELSTLQAMLRTLEPCERVVIVNAHVPRPWQDDANAAVLAASAEFSNVVVADWNYAADGHPEYFGDDGVHPEGTGARAYADTIVEALGASAGSGSGASDV